MRKTILIAGLALLCLSQNGLKAQINLNWLSSFSPAWNNGNTNGNAPNIGGNSINGSVSATINGGGTFAQANGSSGAQTPTVSGATHTIPASVNKLQVTPNFSSNTSYTDIVITFSSPAINVSFRIADIDKPTPGSNGCYDRVTITGNYGASTYNATLSKYDNSDPDFLVISGNSAHVNTTNGQAGNAASDITDQRGTVDVSFGATTLNSITIRYDNAPGVDPDPVAQSIAVGTVAFSLPTLPVSLFSFSGIRQAQNVLLNWSTTQEINSASFEIERNNGSNNWEKIGAVAASGNSTTQKDYSFTDVNPQGSLLLYRLKQIDIDNNYKYSSIVRISGKNANTDILSYPNPFTSQLSININSPAGQSVGVNLYDAGGKMIRNETRILSAGNNSVTINSLDKLAGGIYYIEVKDETGVVLGRNMLLKD